MSLERVLSASLTHGIKGVKKTVEKWHYHIPLLTINDSAEKPTAFLEVSSSVAVLND